MLANIILIAIISVCFVLALSKIIRDKKMGIPSCGGACGGSCSEACRAAHGGRTVNGQKIKKSDLRKIRKRIEARSIDKANGTA
ncbi:FeoB-associated Cys-rich membrane protein [Lachnospiraceae bacterium YH-ros2226]|nr:FeoB-associated Cys-rich membrane protein [Lachnospiraceae bacterium]